MRKIASLLPMLMLVSALAFGQTRTVKGTVRDDKGDPIPFATVTEVGTKKATQADANGNFTIGVTEGARLSISSTGFTSQTLNSSGNLSSITLTRSGEQLSEVVVTTALGVKRRPKEIGYANTTINTQQITSGQSPTLGQALSGKVSGLTIYNQNSSVNNDVRVVLRGNRSISGNNQALIVLDGVPVPQNAISYINPNDIESVTVLKGGQAATLYGSDGVNGALVITTKGGSNKPIINVTHSSNIESVSFFPKVQTEFGSGSDYGGDPLSMDNFRPFENQQYGDAFDGKVRSFGRVLEDGSHLDLPYSFVKDQKKDAFNKGYTIQNGVSLSAGDANSKYFMSVLDYRTHGVVPKDQYARTSFRFNASRTFNRFKASFDGTYAVDRTQRTTSDFFYNVMNTPGQIPLKDFSDWQTDKFANPNGYFNDYYPNPYFAADNNRRDVNGNYFTGAATLELKATDWFNVTYRLGSAVTNTFQKDWTGQFLFTNWAKTKAYTFDPQFNDYNGIYYARNNILGRVEDYSSWGNRLNSDLILTFDKKLSDAFTSKLLLGNNVQVRQSKTTDISSSSIVVPGYLNVSNRQGELGGYANTSLQRKYGYFGDLTLGYNDYLFLHGSVRNDYTSVFYKNERPKSDYSYWYYGADVSLSLTDAFSSLKSSTLNFLKLRAGYNINRNDNLNPYNLDATYGVSTGFPYGSMVGLTTGNIFPDPSLKPEKVSTLEGGFEMALFNNRLNIDASTYTQKSRDNIITAGVSTSTGYTNYLLNAADLDNKGFEVDVKSNIVSRKDFTWSVNANYTYNTNKVIKIFQDLPKFQSAAYSTYGYLFAEINKPFPYLEVTGYQKDPQGRVVVDGTDGWPIKDPNLVKIGNTLPKHIVGFGTQLGYKDFTLGTTLEMRTGYSIYSSIGHDLSFTGAGAITNMYHRKPFVWPNSVVNDGTGKYVTNTMMTDEYNSWYGGWGDYGNPRGAAQIGEFYATSGRFLKVRDITLGYSLPSSLLSRTKVVKDIKLSLIGRNLFMFLPKENIFTDPEFNSPSLGSGSNAIGINSSMNTPTTRSYGVSLNVTF